MKYIKPVISSLIISGMPVNYEEHIRDKIKNSFEKGLKKYLPESLLKDESVMSKFTITANCNESAAYAVTALTEFALEPEDDKNVFYGVFDFGGGTTDFDFGYWRYADNKERRYDYIISNEQTLKQNLKKKKSR